MHYHLYWHCVLSSFEITLQNHKYNKKKLLYLWFCLERGMRKNDSKEDLYVFINIIRVFCQRALHCKRRNLVYSSAEGRSSTANSGTKAAVLPGMNGCGSFPLLSTLHSLFSIWTELKRYEKIRGAPMRRWGEWIWITGPSGIHRNSPQGLNISYIRVFDRIRDPEISTTLRTPPLHLYYHLYHRGRIRREWL